jgi:phospholipase/carboxylesterase
MNNIEQLSIKGRNLLHRPARNRERVRASLVLLHGYGADEYDLMGLASYFDPDMQVLSIRGGGQTPYGGASWFDIDMLSDGSLRFNIDQAKVSTDDVIDIIMQLRDRGIIVHDKIILAGFSQGATISNLISMRQPDLLQALLIMSGRLPEDMSELVGDKSRFKRLPVFAGHGMQDTIIPIEYGRQIVSFWDPIAIMEHHEYPMGHEISQLELEHIQAWLEKVLSRV